MRDELVSELDRRPRLRNALAIIVLLGAVAFMLLIAALDWAQDRAERTESAVEVHAFVTEVSTRTSGGLTTPHLEFVTGYGETGWIEGRSGELGQEITVYRLGSGFYAWEPPESEGFTWVPLGLIGMAGLCLIGIVFAIRGMRRPTRP